MIYLDYNATAPLRPTVKAKMDALAGRPLNPASIHRAGREAKKLLEDARATIATSLSAFPNEVLFTASGTEANNMVLRAFAGERPLLVSAIEHASIGKTASALGAATIPVNADGIVDLAVLDDQLTQLGRPALISVMLANNETGVIQPLAEIARIARTHGALVHADAVQALGKTPLDWGLLGVDMLTISAHKAGGPVGAAALLIRNDLPIKPLLTGGGQELGRRAGTENIPAIVGFATLVEEVRGCEQATEWREWQSWLEQQIQNAAPEAIICGKSSLPLRGRVRVGPLLGFGQSVNDVPLPASPLQGEERYATNPQSPIPNPSPERLPQTLCITMPGVKSETQLMNFDLAGFAVSAGSACSSGRVNISHVLLAMGASPETAETAIRISWGWGTTRAEIEQFAEIWVKMYNRLKAAK